MEIVNIGRPSSTIIENETASIVLMGVDSDSLSYDSDNSEDLTFDSFAAEVDNMPFFSHYPYRFGADKSNLLKLFLNKVNEQDMKSDSLLHHQLNKSNETTFLSIDSDAMISSINCDLLSQLEAPVLKPSDLKYTPSIDFIKTEDSSILESNGDKSLDGISDYDNISIDEKILLQESNDSDDINCVDHQAKDSISNKSNFSKFKRSFSISLPMNDKDRKCAGHTLKEFSNCDIVADVEICAVDEIKNEELGIADDHFSKPEGYFGLTTVEELEMAIDSCKKLIFEAESDSDRQKNLVNKLIQLRIKLQDSKEELNDESSSKVIAGHHFEWIDQNNSKHYCDKCTKVIWGLMKSWYKCSVCSFRCHGKCLNAVTRACAGIKIANNPNYILTICPEGGLAAQSFRCIECHYSLSYANMYDPRLCDYTGNYYCQKCHWNDWTYIPARILHNWDFELRKVSRSSRQYLRLMLKKPVLKICDINPMLFNFVEELHDVKLIREKILIVKKYFLTCQVALKAKLLLQLQHRQHFVDNSNMYALQDLLDLSANILLPEVTKIFQSFVKHIKEDCELCQGKGYICEICESKEILFPFDNMSIVCSSCSTVFHRFCFMRRSQNCPRCARKRRSSSQRLSL